MDTDTITLFAFLLAIGAGLGLLIDSFLKGMYVPKHWHQVLPAFWALIGLHIWEKFKNDIGAFLGMITFYVLAFMHGHYIEKAGILYQGWNTAMNTPDPKPVIVEPAKEMPPVNLGEWQTVNQVVSLPRFDKERNFAVTLLRMYEYDPEAVDLTERKWVKTTKKFIRDEFVNMLHKWEGHGVISRSSSAKNSKYVVRRWDAVRLIANGNPLP